MKKLKVISILMAAAMAIVPMCACAAAETGCYVSTQNVEFMSAYPQYTYKQATFGAETLELYDDGTYCLTVVKTSYSGALAFNDDGIYETVPRGTAVTKFQGTYTAEEDSGLNMVTISAPTAVSAVSENAKYLDSAAWTDDMTAQAGMTGEEYLASQAYEETTLMIDTTTGVFDYEELAATEHPAA